MLKLAFVSLGGCKFFIWISYLIDMWINKYIRKNFAILKIKKKKKTVKVDLTLSNYSSCLSLDVGGEEL